MPRLSRLERLGLHRRELRAWATYEFAITGLYVIVITAVFPVYYQTVLASALPPSIASQRFALATTLGIALIALPAPFIGALTDQRPVKKQLLGMFVVLGAGATASLFYVTEQQWLLALVLFTLINVGVNGSTVFYDALLPNIARVDEVDRVSAGAFALGYVGSTILLTAAIAVIEWPWLVGLPEGTLPVRATFLATAAWWIIFSLPLLARVPEPLPRVDPDDDPHKPPVRAALGRIRSTARSLRTYRQALLLLIAYFVYGDGIGTIIRLAAVYGAELGFDAIVLLGAVMIVQVVGIPATFAFAGIAATVGAQRAILGGLVIYTGITVLAYFMTSAWQFLALAGLIGLVQGGTQALSRALFASMVPTYKSGEFFGFYGVIDKFAGLVGPLVFAGMIALTGSSRQAILSIVVFFILGGFLLARVDVAEGRRVAAEAQARARPVTPIERERPA